jgi:hypothetical protein
VLHTCTRQRSSFLTRQNRGTLWTEAAWHALLSSKRNPHSRLQASSSLIYLSLHPYLLSQLHLSVATSPLLGGHLFRYNTVFQVSRALCPGMWRI